MKLGSKAHKAIFCSSFVESHREFEPELLPWPELNSISLDRLRQIPFWPQAIETEHKAGLMLKAFSETIADRSIRDAVALQAYEESRHYRLIEHLVQHYDIECEYHLDDLKPRDLSREFIEFGFSECLDSFFAFGMFEIARELQYMPEEIFSIFDLILTEEARHIVFFVNWFTYVQIQSGMGFPLLRGVGTIWNYRKSLQRLMKSVGGMQDTNRAFTATGSSGFTDNLSLELVLESCINANRNRMANFDERLLRPVLLPSLSKLFLNVQRSLPSKCRFSLSHGKA